MAPGASLIGMKVFGAASSAYTSVIIQGMDWAVAHDHADIISESFGDHTLPDTALDTIKQFNDAAVQSGVTVSQGTVRLRSDRDPIVARNRSARARLGRQHQLPKLRADHVVRDSSSRTERG